MLVRLLILFLLALLSWFSFKFSYSVRKLGWRILVLHSRASLCFCLLHFNHKMVNGQTTASYLPINQLLEILAHGLSLYTVID